MDLNIVAVNDIDFDGSANLYAYLRRGSPRKAPKADMLPSFEPQHGFHTGRVGPVTRSHPSLKASSTHEMRTVARTAATAWFVFAHLFYVHVMIGFQPRNVARTAATEGFTRANFFSSISWFSIRR